MRKSFSRRMASTIGTRIALIAVTALSSLAVLAPASNASAAAVTKMSQVVAQEYKTYNSRSIAVDSTRLWVTYPYQGLVKVYNKSDRSLITSINVGGIRH